MLDILVSIRDNEKYSANAHAQETDIPRASFQRLLEELKNEKLVRRSAKKWKITDGGREFLGDYDR